MTVIGKILTDVSEFKPGMGVSAIAETLNLDLTQKLEIVKWNSAVDALRQVAFNIHQNRLQNEYSGNSWKDSDADRNALFGAITTIYDMIGVIGAGRLTGANAVYEWVVANSYKDTAVKHGETLRLTSEQATDKNLLKDALAFPNGVNTEYIHSLQVRIDKRDKRLKELSTVYGEISTVPVEIPAKQFESKLSNYLSMIAKHQKPMTAEEYKDLKKAEKSATKQAKAAYEKTAKTEFAENNPVEKSTTTK